MLDCSPTDRERELGLGRGETIEQCEYGKSARWIRNFGTRIGSDVTMIDPSLVEKLGIQGESSQLLLSTGNEREKRQQGLKVDFKISSVDDQDFREIAVCDAWAVKDLTIPLKHFAVRTKKGPVATPTSCLLYTSPSPRDLSTSRMPSSA